MSNDSTTIVQKLWNFCNVLRDDGVSYGDYVEQLTYLLFLKLADEQTKPPPQQTRNNTARLGLGEPSQRERCLVRDAISQNPPRAKSGIA